MATTHEKLANSLEALKEVQQNGVVRAADLSRTHKERLIKAGFLQEVVKGWLLQVDPARLEREGESTAWYGSFWNFIGRYLESRFSDNYALSPEASLWIHTENPMVPAQVNIMAKRAKSQVLQLPNNTSLVIYQENKPPRQKEEIQGLQCLSLAETLCRTPPVFFTTWPREAELALRMAGGASDLLEILLEEGSTVVAGRLAGAYEFLGDVKIAKEIVQAMESAGHNIRLSNPFDIPTPSLTAGNRVRSPLAGRLASMWSEMRSTVIDNFPPPPGLPRNAEEYMQRVEDRYVHDAYHSLSIEGYQVTTELIERVRNDNWNPDGDHQDENQRNAMAAKGYHEAFQSVKMSIGRVLSAEDSAEVAEQDHGNWYRALFSPSVQAGLLKATALAGYRRNQVFIRGSDHVPPRYEVVTDGMEELFRLIKGERHPAVRAVLGHFLFGFIHPYMDGNGRMARFLMNLMLAQGGYPWTIINVERRQPYMEALQQASSQRNIEDFTRLVAEEMHQDYPAGT